MMNAAIKTAVKKLERATCDLRAVLQREQKACPHKQVIHSKWKSSDYGSAFKARRLCLNCGLEEEAKNSGWGDSDSDFTRLKTKGFHKEVDDAWELYRSRFPEASVNGPLAAGEKAR